MRGDTFRPGVSTGTVERECTDSKGKSGGVSSGRLKCPEEPGGAKDWTEGPEGGRRERRPGGTG